MRTTKTKLTLPLRKLPFFSRSSVFICIHLWLISDAAAASIRLPEGIADEKGRTGFFASATGGIECIDLAHGKVLWQTHEAQRPLLRECHPLISKSRTKRYSLVFVLFSVKI